MTLTRFILNYFFFTAFLVAVCWSLPQFFPGITLLVNKFWVIFGFMAGITLIAYVVAHLGIQRKPETGVMAIMGSIVLKLVFCMAFVLVYRLKTQFDSMLFVADFFSLYLLFSGFELYCLLRNLRHQIKK